MGNAYRESNFDPNARSGIYYGLWQWERNQTARLRAYAASTGGDMTSIKTQCDYLYDVVFIKGEGWNYPSWAQKMQETNDVLEATRIFLCAYEINSAFKNDLRYQYNINRYCKYYAEADDEVGHGGGGNWDFRVGYTKAQEIYDKIKTRANMSDLPRFIMAMEKVALKAKSEKNPFDLFNMAEFDGYTFLSQTLYRLGYKEFASLRKALNKSNTIESLKKKGFGIEITNDLTKIKKGDVVLVNKISKAEIKAREGTKGAIDSSAIEKYYGSNVELPENPITSCTDKTKYDYLIVAMEDYEKEDEDENYAFHGIARFDLNTEPMRKTYNLLASEQTWLFSNTVCILHFPASLSGANGDIIAFAEQIANDNHYYYLWGGGHNGSVQPDATGGGMYGLDCSGFVAYVLIQCGYDVGSFTTSEEIGALTRAGFTQIPFSEAACQPGDVLLRSGHTEFFYGDGQMVGAHRSPRNGMSVADSISVTKLSSNWQWILRPPSK